MSRNVRIIQLELGAEDARLLEALHVGTGATNAEVLRWALRHYVVSGPWAATPTARRAVVGKAGPLNVGPMYQEVK